MTHALRVIWGPSRPSPGSHDGASSDRGPVRRGEPRLSLIALILLLPIEGASVITRRDGLSTGAYNDEIVFHLFDIALFFLVLLVLPGTVLRILRRDLSLGVVTALLIVGFAAIALLVNPTLHGLYFTGRLLAMAIVAAEVSQLSFAQVRTRVVAPLLITVSVQSCLALLQTARGEPLGIGFGELAELRTFGNSVGGSGTMLHSYVLGSLSLLTATLAIAFQPEGRWRIPWFAALTVTAAAIGVSYGRAPAFSFVIVLAALAVGVRRDPRCYLAGTLILAASAIVTASIFSSGWVTKAQQTASTDVERASSGRLVLFEQAFDLLTDAPVFGIGPSQYMEHQREKYPPPPVLDVVHFVPLLVAVELGTVAGVAYQILMLALAWRAWRVSPAAFAVAAALSGAMAFDKYTYVHPNGMIMFAIWVGVLDVLARAADPLRRDVAPPLDDSGTLVRDSGSEDHQAAETEQLSPAI